MFILRGASIAHRLLTKLTTSRRTPRGRLFS
jgi:hypothetical protein